MPFRCLDAQYRRELVRVYLSNVESICRKFVEERRGTLVTLRDGPGGLAAFWQALDYKQRHLLASEHGDTLLKVCDLRLWLVQGGQGGIASGSPCAALQGQPDVCTSLLMVMIPGGAWQWP